MKIQIAILAAAATLLACGEDLTDLDEDAGTEFYELSSGTYAVSNAVLASQTDQCGLLGAYTDPEKKIGLTVDGATVTFNLSNSATAAPESLDRSYITGNTIEMQTQTNYTVAFDDTCVVRVLRTVTGQIVGPNTAALTMDFSVATEAGTCDGNNTIFTTVPCASTYQFTATMQ